MSKIVVKFGGSNLKEKHDIFRVAEIIKAYNQPLVVVVSAFYGVTNILTETLKKVLSDEEEITHLLNYLSVIKNEVVTQCIENEAEREVVWNKIAKRLKELERYLQGVNCIGEVPDFIEDIVLSYGERLSSLLLSEVLKNRGFNCEEVLAEELGLQTDGEFGNATIDLEASATAVSERLAGNKIFIVPGFYGISPNGKVTLLGRGGSDYSAASIACCINAPSLDVWKDVNGFMSADPKIVENPFRISRLTYSEAAELAYFGAKILHPRTVEPLMDKSIPIRIFNINNTLLNFEPLTIVNCQQEIRDGVIKSVTYNDDFAVLKLKGPGIGIKSGIVAKVSSALDNEGINIKSIITSQIAINLMLSSKDLAKAYKLTENLSLTAVRQLEAINSVSVIAVVGEGLLEKHGIAARIFGAVARRKINVEITSLGASQVVAYFVVQKEDRTAAVEEIHKEFFSTSEIF
jgi:aspartate kinase/aspartokinase/homoserine dehydrogenase 1